MEQEKKKSRTFNFKDKEYKILLPTLNVVREAKYKYAKAFTDSLKAGFLTKKKMENILFESDDSIFKSYIDRRAEILKLMADTESLLNKTEKPEELEYLAEIMGTYRNTLVQEDLSINSMFSNTADNLAEDEKINFLVFILVVDSENNKLWKSYEDFLNETNMELVESCKYQVMCLDYNLEANWEKDLPETKARTKALDILEANKKLAEELKAASLEKETVVQNIGEVKETKKRKKKKKLE